MVFDGDLSADDLFLGLPVLRHLSVDINILLEEHRYILDESDCSTIETNRGKKVVQLVA